MRSVLSSAARIENFHGERRKRRQKPGDLLIEQVRRSGDLGSTSVGEGSDHDFFSALTAKRHVPRAFLFGERGVHTVLPREKGFRGRQCLGGSERCRGLLKGAVAL